jgi:hypothetical protein
MKVVQSLIIITAANAKYFDLVQGTILSIREKSQGKDAVIGFLDLGCTAEQLQWLCEVVDIIKQADWEFDFPGRSETPEYLKGLFARPFFRKYFPGYDIYFWIDADAWVQDWKAVDLFVRGAQGSGLAVVPEIDRCNMIHYGGLAGYLASMYDHYRTAFGEEVADRLYSYPMLNAGVFALHKDAPHWEVWSECLAKGLQQSSSLMTDQLALNLAVYGCGLLDKTELLPGWCNWTCHCGLPAWDKRSSLLVERFLPHAPIGILHLTIDKYDLVSLVSTDKETVKTSVRYTAWEPELELNLRQINLIIFPDWFQPQEQVLSEIKRVIKGMLNHPDRVYMTLIIEISNFYPNEDANIAISSAIMEVLYCTENCQLDELPEISVLGNLKKWQWQTIVDKMTAKINLAHENTLALQESAMEILPSWDINNFIDRQFALK